MKNCILCKKPTEGSIGAAGYFWSFICQVCKDKEDNALKSQIEYQAKVINLITEKVGA
jgi:hypothetical protein